MLSILPIFASDDSVIKDGPASIYSVAPPFFLGGGLLAVICVLGGLAWAPTVIFIDIMVLIWKSENDVPSLVTILMLASTLIALPLYGAVSGQYSRHLLMRWARFGRRYICGALLLGHVAVLVFFLFLYYWDPASYDMLNGDYDGDDTVAVIGAGASGISASWVLTHGGRKVHLYEELHYLGGHSFTYEETDEDPNEVRYYDLGFIFNNEKYEQYRAFSRRFDNTLIATQLNTSSAMHGKYWDNANPLPQETENELGDEINRFMEFVHQPEDGFRYLVPFGIWVWYHGFSEEFIDRCIKSTLTVLFVTKFGVMKQSTQAILDYFKFGEGFTHLQDQNAEAKVWRTENGSQQMWMKSIDDSFGTGNLDVFLNSSVDVVERDGDGWRIKLGSGVVATYKQVIIALPANVAQRVVKGGFFRYTLARQIDYTTAVVSLHHDYGMTLGQGFTQANERVLYYVGENDDGAFHMTGTIGRIFGRMDSTVLLTVHDEDLKLNESLVKKRFYWSHHYFSIWEIVVGWRFMPLIQGHGGLFYAGDWLYGVGHNDAIKSGIAAACGVGLPREPLSSDSLPLYRELTHSVCNVNYEEVSEYFP